MKHTAPASTIEKVVIPELLAVSIGVSPAHIRGGGVRGFVNEPKHPLNDTMVLFPHDGKGMILLKDHVAFIATTSAIHKISPSNGKTYLSASPIGGRCFASIEGGREVAKGIIRDDIEHQLMRHETARSANQAFDKMEQAGRISFVMPNHQNYGVGQFNLALQQANYEVISEFAQSFAGLTEVQAPSSVIIGGRMTLGGRHDCVMCVAGLELAATAAAYLTGLGWWVVSAYLSPDKTQWCFVMTSTPQETWDYDPTPVNNAAVRHHQEPKKPVPQRVAQVKPHVPAVAREKPQVVAMSFDAIALSAAAAEVVVEQAPVIEVSPMAMVVVPTLASASSPAIDEVTMTPEEPISDEEMEQAGGFVSQADKDETSLLYAALHHLSRNGLGNLRIATKATIAELPEVDIADDTRQTIMMTTVPMFLAATPGWTAAVIMELATANMVD